MRKDPFYLYVNLFTIIALIIIFMFAGKKTEREYREKCKKENALRFEGVVANYSTNIETETSRFTLDGDTLFHVIPRSSKEMHLENGDTIKKSAGQNYYIVRHRFSDWKIHIDTFIFKCP
jgi:hypothetical protein